MRVQMMGGSEDGLWMDVPDGGASMDMIVPALPETFTQPDGAPKAMRVARVPIVKRKGHYYAMWNDREERDL